jgi:hypothetical protein
LIHPIEPGFEDVKSVAPEHAIQAYPVDQRHEPVRLGAGVGLAPFMRSRVGIAVQKFP